MLTQGNTTELSFEQLLDNLLGKLSERECEILKHRYQLSNDISKKATLKKIGDQYDITRERVRQIERDALRKLVELRKEQEFAMHLAEMEQQVIKFLERKGGIVREDQLIKELAEANYGFDKYHTNSFVFVLDNFFESVSNEYNHDYFHNLWKLYDVQLHVLLNWLQNLEKELSAKNQLLQKDELHSLAEQKIHDELKSLIDKYLARHDDLELQHLLESYIETSKIFKSNLLGLWGLSHWNTVSPKKLADKIQLVFEKHRNPLHFREIAEKINEAKFDHKNICPATVHNELIANGNYVLIGRGIYAMQTWGYSAGTVADVITSILKQAGQALSKDDIYEQVLNQRKVNKSTIYLTLINKNKFAKDDQGKFFIK